MPPPPAPEAETRPNTYTVKRGDTLYLIALDHGLDYRELAVWNNIANVDRIYAGQVLRLSPPGEPGGAATTAGAGGVVTAPLRTVPPIAAATPGVAGAPGALATPVTPATPATPGATTATTAPGATPTPATPGETRTTVASAPASRNSETYKTEPKALKQPYSEHALREMQRAAAAAAAPGMGAVAATPPPAGAGSPVASGAAAGPPAAQSPAGAAAPAAPAAAPPVVATAIPGATAPGASAPSDGKGAAADDDEKLAWVWPATGKIVTGFSDTANLKGIDIAGKSGQPVVASAAGKVVYAGSGLRGYGKLIIIKHNKSYLSAYAHNKEILVKEGQQVARGQKIAEMGNTDADQNKLHFEIRRLGKPMDPLKYLPPA